MRADLHCHTTLSDGSLGIEEVIAQAKRNRIDCLAITDHDNLASVSRAVVLGQRYGIRVLPAVEISAVDTARGRKVHILCYMPKKPDRLEGLCLRTCEARKQRGKSMALKVLEQYPIALENIVKYAAGGKAIYKCHIMHALMDYGYTTELYGEVYESLFNAKTGLCAEEVRAETEHNPDVRFALELIHSAGGTAVLAHPKVYDSFDLLEELAASGKIDGAEVYHESANEECEKRLERLADQYGILRTGGSDFHGFYNHYAISLGYKFTPEESVRKILANSENG
ncbi:MAG: PHP domain-containing protein [Bacteroides sp.]|nr:PHP domain-containing protein [Eubacterium sp.]MCM1417166.1 PHP domain-containing protein [Roseburia sp.]MCM1461213.1 PHP domain-containing protein [Bacteroides sp.]